jgi:hypothetical protein
LDGDNNYNRESKPFPLKGERFVLRVADEAQRVQLVRLGTGAVVEEIVVPISWCGCHIEELTVSPCGNWAATWRLSGQGEWGYDVFATNPLARVAGITEERGYALDAPRFSACGTRLVGAAGRYFEWWWPQPDWDHDTASDGQTVCVGFLYVHRLPSHEVTRHALLTELPPGWKQARGAVWRVPRGATPVGEGARITFCGAEVELPAPLGEEILLPTPNPNGTGFL